MRTALYRIWSADHRLLYVGCSPCPVSRLNEHLYLKPWAPDIASITLEWFDNRALALEAEKQAIRAELPEWNVHHRPAAKRANGRFGSDYRQDDPATWVRA